jgi:hypothetical protein
MYKETFCYPRGLLLHDIAFPEQAGLTCMYGMVRTYPLSL